jgi:hypothetical protein
LSSKKNKKKSADQAVFFGEAALDPDRRKGL